MSHSSGNWKSKIMVASVWILVEGPLVDCWLLVNPYLGKLSQLALCDFVKIVILFCRLSPHYFITTKRPHLQIPSYWRLDLEIWSWGWHMVTSTAQLCWCSGLGCWETTESAHRQHVRPGAWWEMLTGNSGSTSILHSWPSNTPFPYVFCLTAAGWMQLAGWGTRILSTVPSVPPQ